MFKFAVHKLLEHSAIVVTHNNRLRAPKRSNKTTRGSKKCKNEPIDTNTVHVSKKDLNQKNPNEKSIGSYKCPNCPHFFTTVLAFVDHNRRKHNNLYPLKESGIKLCPLCDINYHFKKFVEHIGNCTNTMRIGNESSKRFGCVYCKCIFDNISASNFRNHILYCKSFQIIQINGVNYKKCMNCTFTSTDDNSCLVHAVKYCIYFQLKMRYAMGPEEMEKAVQRMEFDEENAQDPMTEGNYQENLMGNETLPSTSRPTCNVVRQNMLKSYNYFCNNCSKYFFDKNVFLYHLMDNGENCRLKTLVYCERCLTDFETEELFLDHLPFRPPPTVSSFRIKQEFIDPSYLDGDVIIDNVILHGNQDDNDVKVFEMNNCRSFHVQEASRVDVISNMQFQEQEVSNVAANHNYAYDEIDNFEDDYMQCVVEDKPDLNQIIIEDMQ